LGFSGEKVEILLDGTIFERMEADYGQNTAGLEDFEYGRQGCP
jgi:hypothetical protein